MTLYSIYFNVSSVNLKEKKRNLEIPCISYAYIYIAYETVGLWSCKIIEMSD